MNSGMLHRIRLLVPFLLFTFLVCGSGSLFCPMAESEAGTHHSQSNSHQVPSTPIHSSGDCPDQFKNAEELSKGLTYGVLPVAELSEFTDIFTSAISHYLSINSAAQSSTYPLLFLLFSVFLN
jgi:hypothetical protein